MDKKLKSKNISINLFAPSHYHPSAAGSLLILPCILAARLIPSRTQTAGWTGRSAEHHVCQAVWLVVTQNKRPAEGLSSPMRIPKRQKQMLQKKRNADGVGGGPAGPQFYLYLRTLIPREQLKCLLGEHRLIRCKKACVFHAHQLRRPTELPGKNRNGHFWQVFYVKLCRKCFLKSEQVG